VALRSAPLAEDIKPVHPGETGGQYKPLDDSGISQITENIFRILEEVGFADATPHCIETCTSVGAIMGDDGRIRMPRAVAENAIEVAARDLVLHGQDPRHDVTLSGQKVHFSTAGAAVMIADSANNLYRESTAQDLYNLARIADSCEHIHIFQRMCVLRDVPDNFEMDLNTTYCSVMGTSKHTGASWVAAGHLKKTLEMLHIIAGGEDKWRARPFVSQSNCFVVPPMKFTEEALECLRIAVEGGMPVLLLSAGQAGATTPACLGPGDPGLLAVRIGSANGRHERRLPRAGPDFGRLCAACCTFRLAVRHRLRHDRCEAPRLPGRRRTRLDLAIGSAIRRQYRLRVRRHVCEPARRLSGKPAAR
jgi:trimethylamine--corrinoid protein Co-methyltransferase